MPNVLVIGGCGYIGSSLVWQLQRLGYDVSVLDVLLRGKKEAVSENTPLYVGDYSCIHLLESVLTERSIECVLHCGAWTDVRESLAEPMMYFVNNLAGTMFLAQAMSRCRVKQIVYLSTASVYGEVGYGLVDESCVPNPVHPDGMTHLGAEQLLASMVAAERWSVVILRLANVVGLPSAGGTFFKKTTLFSTLADVIAGGREQLEIFGVDWPTFDGTAVRDYVQLGDAVRAIVMALAKMPLMGEKTIYNIASGRGDSVRDVVRCFEKVSGKKIPVVELSARPGEIARSVIEPRKIQRELGWERRVNDLESLVRETCGLGKERLFGR